MSAKLQPPVGKKVPRVEIEWVEEVDPRRARRIAEILADILDNATTPEEGRKL